MTEVCKVYVVTPSFNAAETIDRTIQSVISQAGDFELFYHVQDGGSKDETVQILERWKKLIDSGALPAVCRALHFSFESAKDEGLYDAICKGWGRQEIHQDAWMGWINADDMLVQGTCALLALIDNTPSERHIKWVVGGTGVVNQDTVISVANRPITSPVVAGGLCDGRHWHFVQQEGIFFRNIVWRRQDIENDFRKWKYAGDWNLWRAMAKGHRLYQVDRPLGLFRVREGQISQQFRKEYEIEAEYLVPTGKRVQTLRKLAKEPFDRSVLNFAWPTGALSFYTEKLMGEAQTWLNKRVGPHHDKNWQFPAETERRAYHEVRDSLPIRDDFVYFAFPWATLIDEIDNGTAAKSGILDAFEKACATWHRGRYVVTTCQHVRMLSHRALFDKAKITHIFWSHATKGMRIWPGPRPMSISPFPLYPVQVPDQLPFSDEEQREFLYTFVGAKANTWYLSEVRSWILDYLRGDSRGAVMGRDDWHYNKIVYDHQIQKTGAAGELVDDKASVEFKELLQRSTFALCPSGSGPNSIRLWESIGAGTIPVIMADTYATPGNQKLWEEAAVFCEETEEAVRALPDRLEAIAADRELIARKRRALRQLWLLYCPKNFIHDIRKLAFSYAPMGLLEARHTVPKVLVEGERLKVHLLGRHSNRTPASYPAYEPLFRERIKLVNRIEQADVVLTGFDLDFRENIERARDAKAAKPNLRFVVMSEEPLWDVVWASEFRKRTGTISEKGETLDFTVLNHMNSDLFKFESLPYFVTTSDDYMALYNHLFARNAAMTVEQVMKQWKEAQFRAAFYAEKRADARYAVVHDDLGVRGLSSYRTELAEQFEGDEYPRVGMGWGDAPRRQALPDWHLDKIERLDRKSFLISALENTHQKHYVTEKIFDAFAAGGVPIYYAAPDHAVHSIVKGGFVNLWNKSPEEAAKLIREFQPTTELAEAWIAAQTELAARFSDPLLLIREKARVATEVLTALEAVLGIPEAKAKAAEAASAAPAEAGEKGKPVAAASAEAKAAPAAAAPPPAAAAVAPAPAKAAGAASANGLAFTSAAIIENFKDGGDYEHLNIRIERPQILGEKVDAVYVKLQRIGSDSYGVELVGKDIVGSDLALTNAEGEPIEYVSMFFGLEASSVPNWSVAPSEPTRQVVSTLAGAIPKILRDAQGSDTDFNVEDWDDALAALEGKVAERLKA